MVIRSFVALPCATAHCTKLLLTLLEERKSVRKNFHTPYGRVFRIPHGNKTKFPDRESDQRQKDGPARGIIACGAVSACQNSGSATFLRKGIGPSSARKVLFRRTRRRKSDQNLFSPSAKTPAEGFFDSLGRPHARYHRMRGRPSYIYS